MTEDVQLPDDVLADVFRRLQPRCLAVCRCVLRAWRRVIDDRRLLCADLLPLKLAGIFVQFENHIFPEFFSRPRPSSTAPANVRLDFLFPLDDISDSLAGGDCFIEHHCNGLLLLRSYVVNPATRRWGHVPYLKHGDPMRIVHGFNSCIVFDPVVSPHYEVFAVPFLHEECVYKAMATRHPRIRVDPLVEQTEWPPSTCIINVFSSRSHRWEVRSFAREGDAPGSVAEMRRGWPSGGAVYWRRALYAYCQTIFVMRISLCDHKYRVIKAPLDMRTSTQSYLGRSKKGVYLASIGMFVLRVWILDESTGQMKWDLKGDYNLKPVLAVDRQVNGPWVLEDINYDLFRYQLPKVHNKATIEEEFEWSSDNEDVVGNIDVVEESHHRCKVLGFHPYKEIIFLSSFAEEEEWKATVHAYHLSSSRIECLGSMRPTHYDSFEPSRARVRSHECFPYTPCWIDEFPSNT